MTDPSEVPSAAALIERVAAGQRRPAAFQALWDGDSDGWGLKLEVVFKSTRGLLQVVFGLGSAYEASSLVFLRFGGDIRLFQGAVPPWPESTTGAELGAALSEHFGVPFWFPSPTEPDDDCPNWWERRRAYACRDCKKPILARTAALASEKVCVHCQLRREHLARLRADEPSSPEGVTLLLGDGTDERRLGYTSDPVHMAVARFAVHSVGRAEQARATGELVLAGDDVRELEAHLATEVRILLEQLERRPARKDRHGFGEYRKVIFEGKELDLEIHFDAHARRLHNTILDLETARHALSNGLRYWLLFRHGMTTRTDRVLRMVLQLGGHATLAALAERCHGELNVAEVRAAVARLADLGHVVVDRESVRLTRKGHHIC